MSKKVLVVGDYILDQYEMHTCTRVCPEAPVPVLVHKADEDRITDGGAALVANQLRELIGSENVPTVFGSTSLKKRIFADGHLICRIDEDSRGIVPRKHFYTLLAEELQGVDAVIVSDYGKGAMDKESAELIMDSAEHTDIPVFVDAKKSWDLYPNAFAFFPNRFELPTETHRFGARHIIQKLGEHGCSVNGELIPPTLDHPVRDTTGAGDIFIASFVASFLQDDGQEERGKLLTAARFANRIAGYSVEHVGTYIWKGPSFIS